MALVPSMKKRRTIAEQITGIMEGDDEVYFTMMEELEEDEKEAILFRPHAVKTQSVQDHHLGLYHMCIRMFYRRPDMDETEVEKYAWPDDHKLLIKQLRNFVTYVARNTQSNLRDRNNIMYLTLENYRRSMLFWANRFYRDREAPNKTKMYNGMTESMQSIYRKLVGPGRGKKRKMPRVGLTEMRQLIDEDAFRSACPENAEQHHLIWCIGHQTAVRASSIAHSRTREGRYLRWRDTELSRSSGTGRFKAVITFQYLKTNKDDPEAGDQTDLVCHCESPNAENIVFSIPHRLLVMAIRRKLLVGIDSVDALWQSDKQYILVDPAHLDDPVFYASAPRGLALDTTKALKSEGIQDYLRTRGRSLGYGRDISFHAFRRQTATELVKRIGYERTRQIMCHAPDSRTLERYYVNLQSTTDLTGLALDPESVGSLGVSTAIEPGRLSMTALNDQGLEKSRGAALNAMVSKMIDEDDEFPGIEDERVYKNYLRRARRIAAQTLAEHEHRLQTEQMTRDQFERRLDDQNIFAFSAAVRERAVENAKLLHSQQNDPRDDDPAYDNEFDEVGDDDDHASDIEDELQPDQSGQQVVRVTGPEFEPTKDDDIPYEVTAKTFMQVLLDNSLVGSQHQTWKERSDEEKKCPLCREDDSVNTTQTNKVWGIQVNLRDHMMGTFHSKKEVWLRWAKIRHNQQGPDDTAWYCTYGNDPEHSGHKQEDLKRLIRHIQTSSVKTQGQAHEGEKAADGWFDEDWMTLEATPRRKREITQDWQAYIKKVGLNLPKDKRIEMTRDKDEPWLFHGSSDEWVTHEGMSDMISGAASSRGRQWEQDDAAILRDLGAKSIIKAGDNSKPFGAI